MLLPEYPWTPTCMFDVSITPGRLSDVPTPPPEPKRLHQYMLEVEHIGIISNEMRAVVEELWPELAHKLPPRV